MVEAKVLSGLAWTCWEQPSDPYAFKADCHREMDEAEFARWAAFCEETFGPGSAVNGSNNILTSRDWRWIASRYVTVAFRRANQFTNYGLVSRFGFRQETDRFVFVLAASGEGA